MKSTLLMNVWSLIYGVLWIFIPIEIYIFEYVGHQIIQGYLLLSLLHVLFDKNKFEVFDKIWYDLMCAKWYFLEEPIRIEIWIYSDKDLTQGLVFQHIFLSDQSVW